MTREELKEHCERQIEGCETWAKYHREEPSGKVYEEHKLILELLEQEPCEDCISRQAMLEIQAKYAEYVGATKFWQMRDEIKVLPPITPQSKTGHWVEENINEWSLKVFCSECGCTPPFEHISNGNVYSASGYGVSNKTKFCPNCGTRMIEQQGE